jgi:REP element-mobilizing transposase RayT
MHYGGRTLKTRPYHFAEYPVLELELVGEGFHPLPQTAETQPDKKISLQDIIRRLKSYTTKRFNTIQRQSGFILWQRSYYERNENELLEIREYIKNNALKWQEDQYYVE